MKKLSKKARQQKLRSPFFAQLCAERGLTKGTQEFKRCVRLEAFVYNPNRNAAARRELDRDYETCGERGLTRDGTKAEKVAFYDCVDALIDRRNRVSERAARARRRQRGA